MKRAFFLAAMLVILTAAPAWAAEMADQIAEILGQVIMNVLALIGIIVLFYLRKAAHAITAKIGADSMNDTIDRALESGVLYAEEWAHRKIKDTGVHASGAEKFERAYEKAAGALPFLDSDTIRDYLVSKLGDLRAQGYMEAREYLEGKFPGGASG